MIPKDQGVPPATMVTLTGGECEWASDDRFDTDGSMVAAVSVWTRRHTQRTGLRMVELQAEPLVCPEE